MQVSKGLKRATGRGEQVQHHLGTLNFDVRLQSSMPVFPKVPQLDGSSVSVPGGNGLRPAKIIARPAKLDFAANPNHYRVNGSGRVEKAKPRSAGGINLSPRVVLGLSLKCETTQLLDPEYEE